MGKYELKDSLMGSNHTAANEPSADNATGFQM
jgi:hypothetical protein